MTRFRPFFLSIAAAMLQTVACAVADSQALRAAITGSRTPLVVIQTADRPSRAKQGGR